MARVLKECAGNLSPAIADFYQQTLDEGEVPADWKQQRINPIFKKASWTDPANYHPVALTCILCKSLEHIIASQLHTHLDRHKFLCDNQHGFRKYRSCETQLYCTIRDFVNALEKGNRVDYCVGFLQGLWQGPPWQTPCQTAALWSEWEAPQMGHVLATQQRAVCGYWRSRVREVWSCKWSPTRQCTWATLLHHLYKWHCPRLE